MFKTKPRKPTPVIDLSIADDVHQILEPCPEEGQGVHQAVLGSAQTLWLLGYKTQEEVFPMIEEWASDSVGTERLANLMSRELPQAWAKVLADAGEPADYVDDFGQLHSYVSKPRRNWYIPEPAEVLGFAKEWGATTTAWESVAAFNRSSPIDLNQLSEDTFATADWLKLFFAPEEWICVAPASWGTEVRTLQAWIKNGDLNSATYFSPNPYRGPFTRFGITVPPKRRDADIATRRFINTEFDIALKDKKGNQSKWAPLLQQEKIHPLDVQFAIFRYLQQLNLLKLHSVVFSGTKSLHGLWRVNDNWEKFYHDAVAHGVDRCHLPPSQLARCYVPQQQPILYLDV